jgi:trigger factor
MKIEKKDLPKGLVEFSVVVDAAELESFHDKAFAEVQKSVEVDGFRKGNAPEALVVKKYGEMVILEEMANFALRAAYVKAVEEHKVNPVGEPQVTITKIAKGNPLELTITVPIMPEIALPAYKKIAKDAITDGEVVSVTEKDISDVLEELRKGRSIQNNHAHDHEHGEDCDHVEEAKSDEDVESQQASTQTGNAEAVLPELNDEFAQSYW